MTPLMLITLFVYVIGFTSPPYMIPYMIITLFVYVIGFTSPQGGPSNHTFIDNIPGGRGPVIIVNNIPTLPPFTPLYRGDPLPPPYPPSIYDVLSVKRGG